MREVTRRKKRGDGVGEGVPFDVLGGFFLVRLLFGSGLTRAAVVADGVNRVVQATQGAKLYCCLLQLCRDAFNGALTICPSCLGLLLAQ